MRLQLIASAAFASMLAAAAPNVARAATVTAMHPIITSAGHSQIEKADYYHHHRRYKHRRWHHHHWEYY